MVYLIVVITKNKINILLLTCQKLSLTLSSYIGEIDAESSYVIGKSITYLVDECVQDLQ